MPKQKFEYGLPVQVFQRHFIKMRELLLLSLFFYLKQIKLLNIIF